MSYTQAICEMHVVFSDGIDREKNSADGIFRSSSGASCPQSSTGWWHPLSPLPTDGIHPWSSVVFTFSGDVCRLRLRCLPSSSRLRVMFAALSSRRHASYDESIDPVTASPTLHIERARCNFSCTVGVTLQSGVNGNIIYIYIYIYIYIHIHIYTHTHTHIHTYTHTHIHTYTHTHIHTYTHTHIHTYTNTHIHAYTHTHTHIHTYTHTHIPFAKNADSAAAAVMKCTVKNCKSGPESHQKTRKNENAARKGRARSVRTRLFRCRP